MTVRFTDEDGRPSNVVLNESTGEVRYRVHWSRIGQLVAAVVLIVIGWSIVTGMLDLADDPLPPCSQATITHTCGGAP
ncbi:hypothetical protein SEA_TEMPO_106 [Microbacterium phage Tempo]|nr:hypothetical protein SEA_TEMPO_106 [Microbacterium phage Tempo]QKO02856.1 hypothetical protein SEA_KELCOLE_104 [Microbacterium phage Kelcole]WNN94130.1 membrane protein [Microbacterium phage Fregley]